MKRTIALLTCVLLTAVTSEYATAQSGNETAEQGPPVYYVLMHTPGEAWVDSLSFQDQSGVMDHVQYMATFQGGGRLLIGGPFLDNSGGMAVFQTADKEEAEKIATDDPAVKSGLLRVEVKPWLVAFSSLKK